MSLYNITVVNNAPGCNNQIDQQLSVTGCNTYIVRLSQNSNALGPFSIYINSVLYNSGYTRTEMFNGIPIQLGPGCITPTPTPSLTPTLTPTPGGSPTPTPSITPTKTPAPTVTPTSTLTPTPTATPGGSPTPTPSFTPTTTATPTPTSTPQTFEISIITQYGFSLLNQNGTNWIAQQITTSYLVSSGDSSCNTGTYSLTQTLYSASPDWSNIVSFYTDSQLTIPFNGNNLWYTNDLGGCGMYQVGTDGFVIGGLCNPC